MTAPRPIDPRAAETLARARALRVASHRFAAHLGERPITCPVCGRRPVDEWTVTGFTSAPRAIPVEAHAAVADADAQTVLAQVMHERCGAVLSFAWAPIVAGTLKLPLLLEEPIPPFA